MRENKKKESIFAKRGFFVAIVTAAALMVIMLVMNLIVPEEPQQTFDEEAWESAVQESAERTMDEDARPVAAATLPRDAEETQKQPSREKTEPETEEAPEIEDTAAKPAETTGEASESHPPENLRISLILEKPVPGQVTKDFSAEELVYFETMQDWRVHEGMDFAAAEGEEVKAAADGTVESVAKDGMLGAHVIVSHTGGIKTLYGNLAEDGLPSAGTAVKTGDVIGKVGKTAALEINDGDHLHFQVMQNGEMMDPKEFFDTPVREEGTNADDRNTEE